MHGLSPAWIRLCSSNPSLDLSLWPHSLHTNWPTRAWVELLWTFIFTGYKVSNGQPSTCFNKSKIYNSFMIANHVAFSTLISIYIKDTLLWKTCLGNTCYGILSLEARVIRLPYTFSFQIMIKSYVHYHDYHIKMQ